MCKEVNYESRGSLSYYKLQLSIPSPKTSESTTNPQRQSSSRVATLILDFLENAIGYPAHEALPFAAELCIVEAERFESKCGTTEGNYFDEGIGERISGRDFDVVDIVALGIASKLLTPS